MTTTGQHRGPLPIKAVVGTAAAALAVGLVAGFVAGQSWSARGGPDAGAPAGARSLTTDLDSTAQQHALSPPDRRPAPSPSAPSEVDLAGATDSVDADSELPALRWRLGEELPLALEPWRAEYRDPVPPFEFEVKYADADLETLRASRDAIAAEWRAKQRSALAARYLAGEFLERQADMETDLDRDGLPDTDLGFTFENPRGEPRKQVTTRLRSDGVHVVDVTWLPFDEFPELYAMDDEVLWLMQKISSLEAEDAY